MSRYDGLNSTERVERRLENILGKEPAAAIMELARNSYCVIKVNCRASNGCNCSICTAVQILTEWAK